MEADKQAGIWRSIFGWRALFRWDALGAVVPGIFIAAGLGMLSVDWFPYHLLFAQVCFAIAGFLCVVKIIGHAIESNDKLWSRWIFGILLGSFVICGTGWVIFTIQRHKELVALALPMPPLTEPDSPHPPATQSSPSGIARHEIEVAKQHFPPSVPVKTPPSVAPATTQGTVTGSDNTTYGNVPFETINGNGNTFIGPTDSHGNTIIPLGTVAGNGAQGGPGSIAIGAHSGSVGSQSPINQMATAPCTGNSVNGSVDNSGCNPQNPYKPEVSYTPIGIRRSALQGKISEDDALEAVSDKANELINSKKWDDLLALANKTKQGDPGWFSLDYSIGLAELNLCQTLKGQHDLQGFISETAEAPQYATMHQIAQRIMTSSKALKYPTQCLTPP